MMEKKVKITVGTIRPDWGELGTPCGIVVCSCSQILDTARGIRVHYDMGHFDVPQNIEVDVDEIIVKVSTELIERLEKYFKKEWHNGKKHVESSVHGKTEEKRSE